MDKIQYLGHVTGTGPTPIIWADCPVLDIMLDPGVGHMHFDDFNNYSNTATTVANASGYPVYEGNTTITHGSVQDGVLEIFGTTNDNEGALQVGQGASFVISDTAANSAKLWFECRVKKSIITATEMGFFVGLAQEGAGVASFMAATDFAAVSLIGFWNAEAAATAAFVYKDSAGALTTPIATVDTLVADTYVKWGFVYDPLNEPAKQITVYVDGVEQTTYVTATNIATSTFPDGDLLTPIIATEMAATADDVTVSMDWWRCAQLRVAG